MAPNNHRSIYAPRSGLAKRTALLVALLILLAFPLAAAQQQPASPTGSDDDPYNTKVSPALAILVVAIVSAFFLLGFFSVYLRRCASDRSAIVPSALAGIAGGMSRRGLRRGLDPSLLGTFPTMVYSEVKGQKLGKESLECAVCLCEFEDDDILRLLPRCSHVFHRDCIDVWLATHVTCPVCRRNLADGDDDPRPETGDVAVGVNDEGEESVNGEDLQADLADLVRIGSLRREAAARSRSGSVRRIPVSSRSSGDWVAVVAASGGEGERFRLRLPEDVRREILAAGQLRRSSSFAVFPSSGEGSSRRSYREGGGRAWRSLRLGRSGRWPFLGRSFSARVTGEPATGEESVSGEAKGSVVTAAKVPFEGISGSRGKTDGDVTSSLAALDQV